MLILAAVGLSSVFSDKGIFSRAENAGEKYNEAKAREVLETVLLTDGQYEKNINPEYNQDEFLDDLIKNEIPSSDVKGDVAIIGKYAYELDRSVPKVGRYLGKVDDLVFPTVTATEPVLTPDYRTSSFTVTALEEKNGINKIEIWFAGEKIETLTKTYDNVKTEITESFTVNRNGKYTIKAYGDLMASVAVGVKGIVPAVEFSPNGSTEWKKGHTTKIIVKETGEKVTSLKYKWTTSSANPPTETEFTENCPTNQIVIGGNDTMTGEYYLWVLLTTETGKTNICGSQAFYFDNEAPIVELTSTPVSETSFTLTATASDNKSGIGKYELYVDGIKVEYQIETNGTITYTWNGTGMTENKECYVIVNDTLGNSSKKEISARTLLYTWDIYTAVHTYKYWWSSWSGGDSEYSIIASNESSYSQRFAYTEEPTIDDPTKTGTTMHGKQVRITRENLYTYRNLYTDGVIDAKKYSYTRCVGTPNSGNWIVYFKVYERRRLESDNWSKGNKTGTYAYSSQRSKYPNDGKSGSNWYVYCGIK